LESRGATRALVATKSSLLRIYIKGISCDGFDAGMLYNTAREILEISRPSGLKLYEILRTVEPSYEERWYFHRDLGISAYQSGRFDVASTHYDRASILRPHDWELLRMAGDAHFYGGNWGEALNRFERATELEDIEQYFLREKILYTRKRIRNGNVLDRSFDKRRRWSSHISSFSDRLVKLRLRVLSTILFKIATAYCEVDSLGNRRLADLFNRKGHYLLAAQHLERALTLAPEDPIVRLNLVANLLFSENGRLTEDIESQIRIAFFHGGPNMRHRLSTQMTNTPNREEICNRLSELLDEVEEAWRGWQSRRNALFDPEHHDGGVHTEWR